MSNEADSLQARINARKTLAIADRLRPKAHYEGTRIRAALQCLLQAYEVHEPGAEPDALTDSLRSTTRAMEDYNAKLDPFNGARNAVHNLG